MKAAVIRMEKQNTDISKGKLLGLSGWMWHREGRSNVKDHSKFLAWMTGCIKIAISKPGYKRRSRQLKKHVFFPRTAHRKLEMQVQCSGDDYPEREVDQDQSLRKNH